MDKGFDIAIVLTKGTKALSSQTVARFKKDFAEFIEEDAVALFDIMQMPPRLSVPESNRKLIFIAKKQKLWICTILRDIPFHSPIGLGGCLR